MRHQASEEAGVIYFGRDFWGDLFARGPFSMSKDMNQPAVVDGFQATAKGLRHGFGIAMLSG